MAKLWLILCSHAAFVLVLYAMSSNKDGQVPVKRVMPLLKHKGVKSALRQGIVYAESNSPGESEMKRPIALCSCSKIYDPICASNNRSYFNPCQMDCEAKENNESVFIVHQGSCIPYK